MSGSLCRRLRCVVGSVSALSGSGPGLRVQHRRFGIVDRFTKKVTDFVAEKSEDAAQQRANSAFKKQFEMLSSTQVFNFKAFLDFEEATAEESGVLGWKSHVPGLGASDDMKENVKKNIAIMKAMLQVMEKHKIKNPSKLDFSNKQEVCAKVEGECTVADVNVQTRRFRFQKSFHTWVHDLKKSGKPLPQNSDELKNMLSSNPIQIPMDLKKRMSPSSMRQISR